MRKITAWLFVSLDGVMESPEVYPAAERVAKLEDYL
jgi:hypothetical protein